MFVHKTQGINKANKLREAIENEQKKNTNKKIYYELLFINS